MENSLWKKNEFEQAVISGIIGLYETRKKKYKLFNISEKEISKIKRKGLYFAPSDRITYPDMIDILPPNNAYWSWLPEKECDIKDVDKNGYMSGYVNHSYCEKITRLPPEYYQPMISGEPYAIYIISMFSNSGLFVAKQHGFIDKNNNSVPLRRHKKYIQHIPFPEQEKKDMEENSFRLACTINIDHDRKYLWNVKAKEKDANVLFGVYPEQIQSLFYARQNPITETGRKRPILHWISSHKRRLKEGVEIDIGKHLRGINSFEMNGTLFEITLPTKKDKKNGI